MDSLNNANRFDRHPDTYDPAAETSQRQAGFEQHISAAAQEPDTAYPHKQLFDIAEEDDRLIQAATDLARARRVPASRVTIGIFDHRLRELARELKLSGKTMALLDDANLLDSAQRLFPNDKVMLSALSLIDRYRDPDAPARPSSTKYRASKEDERFLKEAVIAGFGRMIDQKSAGNYATSLRKLAAALRPSSLTRLDHNTLVGHADSLFPKDKKLLHALDRLQEYRVSTGQIVSRENADSSRAPPDPIDHLPMPRLDQEQPLDRDENPRGAGVIVGFDPSERWPGMDSAAHWGAQNADKERQLGVADLGHPLSADRFDQPSTHFTHQRSGSAVEQGGSPAIATHAGFGWQLSEVGGSSDRMLQQAPVHQAGISQWEAQAAPGANGHEYNSVSRGEGGNVAPPVVSSAEDHDQDLLWGMLDEAGRESSLPTWHDPKGLDFAEATRPINWPHKHHPAPAAQIFALEGSGTEPNQENRPTRFVINADRYTALLVPAGVRRQSNSFNPHYALVQLGHQSEGVPRPTGGRTTPPRRSSFTGQSSKPAPGPPRVRLFAPPSARFLMSHLALLRTFPIAPKRSRRSLRRAALFVAWPVRRWSFRRKVTIRNRFGEWLKITCRTPDRHQLTKRRRPKKLDGRNLSGPPPRGGSSRSTLIGLCRPHLTSRLAMIPLPRSSSARHPMLRSARYLRQRRCTAAPN
ncbi:hypothetical protein [Bradyrhizobium sp. NAS96.2]|uniref:hypothetical protein n=1 Tax=Bradyrhizobium sp. NAS96.2 TaxID=1680160 RepID=UPI000B0A7946|nr:hypothetical protein [Bradyrhizobium sp. NAS96.2]